MDPGAYKLFAWVVGCVVVLLVVLIVGLDRQSHLRLEACKAIMASSNGYAQAQAMAKGGACAFD